MASLRPLREFQPTDPSLPSMLQVYRLRALLRLADVARLADVTEEALRLYEHGRDIPSISELQRLVLVLDPSE